ncbi:MAG TPA: molecular chaperone TorD family protein [archaeon]|nr:molecular chaperone TorD family protein [archaeon]
MLNDNSAVILRSRIYRILAAALSPPKEDPGATYDALLEVKATLPSNKTPLDVTRTLEKPKLPALAKEYLRLFVGPGHMPCPPYEAVHRKDRPDFERGLVMGPSTADVRRAYLAAGLDLSKTYTDLPDHIAAEMEFMQFLCAETTRLEQQGDREEAAKMKTMQREFHKNHIAPWVGDFADCIIRSTTEPFYKTTANVLKEFTKIEADFLTEAE